MNMLTGAAEERRKRIALLAIFAVGSVMLWQTYWGSILLYPFTILATWFHEMGHGIAAMLVGYEFDRLLIYPNGSGVAMSKVPVEGSRIASAVIAASGPLGPPLAGAALIIASRRARGTKWALMILGGALLISSLIWVRSLTGWLVLVPMGLIILAAAFRARTDHQRLILQLLGVQGCLSVYRDLGYMFSQGGVVGGLSSRSDTQAIADVLVLPYWFWGASITAGILALLFYSFRYAFRP